MEEKAKIILDGSTYEFPVLVGTENEKAIDISSLRAESGYITIDRGFKNTGSTKSAITFLDGEKGILRYRGYSIDELAEKASFLEVSYLLIYGDLPTKTQYQKFIDDIKKEIYIHEDFKYILEGIPSGSHPMAILSALVCSLTGFHPEDSHSEDELYISICKLMAKVPTMVAWAYRHSKGLPLIYPKKDLEYCENYLNMMFAMPNDNSSVDPVIAKAFNKLLILHADHEQNCSTSAVRITGSSHATLFVCVSAGINALWGPLHGGANQAVIEMLEAIKLDGGDTAKYLKKAKDKADPFRLMGFGHRVYKNFDPRARIIKGSCDQVLNQLGVKDPILNIAKGLEEEALKDSYFVERKLYPNVDFYSGVIYRALGIPTDMFTVIFSMGRLPGWIAQWREMRNTNEPIGRPRQLYIGKTNRPFQPLKDR